jgi:hypothetical protein
MSAGRTGNTLSSVRRHSSVPILDIRGQEVFLGQSVSVSRFGAKKSRIFHKEAIKSAVSADLLGA